jgi:hypothetical protein
MCNRPDYNSLYFDTVKNLNYRFLNLLIPSKIYINRIDMSIISLRKQTDIFVSNRKADDPSLLPFFLSVNILYTVHHLN